MRLMVFALLLVSSLSATAHDLGLARITLESSGPGSVRLDARLPIVLEPSAPQVAQGCTVNRLGERAHNRLDKTVSWLIGCDPVSESGDRSVFLDWQREAALVIVLRKDGTRTEQLIDADAGSIRLDLTVLMQDAPGIGASAIKFLKLGFEHILEGVDHLAFILGLCLIAGGWNLVKLVTAFTVGHSLSLAAASLGWVNVPSPPSEALIALSIAFIAREALVHPDQRSHSYPLVVIFGLLHGLGFAGALSALGVVPENLVTALISFNIGVELGQLVFIAGVLFLVAVLRSVTSVNLAVTRTTISIGLGSIAIFWTLERVASFLPESVF
ncbi:MAG: HupE/UreJ family protein [Candidatus Thiodiazotropha sp.]